MNVESLPSMLKPTVMLCGDGAFGKKLGHQAYTFHDEVSALVKRQDQA
jgi:hypothetical protein